MPAPEDMKTVKIQVPADFDLPPFYSDASLSKRALALRLGAEAAQILQKKAFDSVRAETHVEAVKQATAEFEAQLAEQAGEAATLTSKLRHQVTKAEEAHRAAQLRIEALEMEASRARQSAQKEVRDAMTELLAAKDGQIRQLQATLEKQMEAVALRMEGLQMSLTKTSASSKAKGDMAEGLVEGWLKRAFDCDVHAVSKDRETADIRLTRASGVAYFWEVKNYTRMVSTEEVTKFKRDLALHPDVRGGILVSLRQGIVGHARGGDIDLEFLEDGRFILFLSNVGARDDPVFYFQSLRPFFDVVEAVAKPVQEETAAVRALEAKAELITNLLRSHSMGVTKHKNALVGHKRRMDSMFAEFQGYLLEAESQLSTLLRIAVGTEAQAAEAAAEVDTALSPFVFKKGRVSDCADEKQREFVKWLLGVAETREGTQMEIKELLGRAKEAGFSEKTVRDQRELLFQDTAWPKGARFIVGMRWLAQASAVAAAVAAEAAPVAAASPHPF